MGQRVRGVAILVVLLGAGTLLGSAVAQWWQRAPAAPPEPPSVAHVEGRIRVEVLNGGGASGVARDATRALRDLGLDVVYYGNAETFSPEPSVVLDRVGRLESARAVADALGIREVVSEPDSSLFVDVTVRLGPEWSLRLPAASPEESGTAAWWDPRRFFRKEDPGGTTPRGNNTGP